MPIIIRTKALYNRKSPDFGSDSSLSNNNQTNTALKGIIGIGAFAKMAALAGVDSDHESYNVTTFFIDFLHFLLTNDPFKGHGYILHANVAGKRSSFR